MTAPLAGVRVLDLSQAMSGPYATMMLADAGADVIKLEPPDGDHVRSWLQGRTPVSPYIMAVAAICLSSGFSACGTRSFPHICAISPSNGRIASA